VTLPESSGETQGSSRRTFTHECVVGRKPQDGWCPWFATLGYTDSSAIETVQRPPTYRAVPRKGVASERGEAQDGRARENVFVVGEEKAVKRRLGRVAPAGPKGSCEVPRSEETPGAQRGCNKPCMVLGGERRREGEKP